MTFEEKERKIESLVNGSEKMWESTTILYVENIFSVHKGTARHYVAWLYEKAAENKIYGVIIPQDTFEGCFEDKRAMRNPKKLAAVVKSLKAAGCGVILDAEGWKELRAKCIQRADSSDSDAELEMYAVLYQEIEDIFLMYAGNFEEKQIC